MFFPLYFHFGCLKNLVLDGSNHCRTFSPGTPCLVLWVKWKKHMKIYVQIKISITDNLILCGTLVQICFLVDNIWLNKWVTFVLFLYNSDKIAHVFLFQELCDIAKEEASRLYWECANLSEQFQLNKFEQSIWKEK